MKKTLPILFSVFFLSGFSGLIYESVWSHYIKLILGHAAYAQTLVLMIFMGGMALGAWGVSRISGRTRNPLLLYATIEGVIGLFGIFFHQEFLITHHLLFDVAITTNTTPVVASVIKWMSAALMLLPQAVLLGTTFPLMSAAIIRVHPGASGRILGMLYFTNSIGAAIGVLASGFVLIEMVGLPGTVLTAGIINILLALASWGISKKVEFNRQSPAPEPTAGPQSVSNVLIAVAALTGTASFFYEIGWIRMLSLVLSSSVQAFELMLSAFIAGLAMGSYFIRKRIDGIASPGIYLAWIQIIMGLLAVATLPLYVESFSWMSFLINGLSKTREGYSLFNLSSQLIALLIMFPATFMAGMTLPLLTNTLLKSGGKESAIGLIYSANTIGSIVGVMLAVHLVMPSLGVKAVIIVGSLIDISLGLLLLQHFSRRSWRKLQIATISAVLVAVGLFSLTPFDNAALSSGVYRFGKASLAPNDQVTFYKDGKTTSISLITHANGNISIRTNGKADASIAPYDKPFSADEVTMVMAAMVPLAMNPEARTVANIGLGSGLTTHALLAGNTIKRLDTIEIEYSMVEAARGFGRRVERAFNDPRSAIHIDDAKSFFTSHRKKYDIIISEPSNPWINGVASLFTQEFYDHIKTYLTQNGIFVQWLQLYETDINNIASVMRALAKSFENFQIYNTDNSDMLIVAGNGIITNHLNPWIFEDPRMQAELGRVGIERLSDIEIRYLGDKQTLMPLFLSTGAPANSDYFPYLSYHAPKTRYLNTDAADISWIHLAEVPVLDWINGKTPDKSISSSGNFFEFYEKQKSAFMVVSGSLADIPDQRLRFSAMLLENQIIAEQQPTYLVAAQVVAGHINPYLDKQELSTYWRHLRDKAATSAAAEDALNWLDLHHAISQHNAVDTIRLATTILSSTETLSVNQNRYLVTAVLTAYVAQGEFTKAQQFLLDHQLLKQQEGFDTTMKLLVNLAISGRH